MRHFCAILLLTTSLLSLNAQTVCEGFEGLSVPTQDRQHAFNIYGNGNPGFLSKWNVTHGTPAIYTSGQINGINAYQGSQYALLAVCNDTNVSEGFSIQQDFIKGKTYTVTMAIRNFGSLGSPIPINVQYVLLDSTIPFNYQTNTGCTNIPDLPASSKVVFARSNFAANGWQLISFNVTNLNKDYHHLWIRPFFPSGKSTTTTYFLMDTFCIKEWVPNGCYSFEEYFVPLNETAHAFDTYGNGKSGFLQDWHVVNGTPSIYSTGQLGSVFAYKGDQYALLTVCGQSGNFSEGLSLSHNFETGKSYTVSMAMRNRGSGSTPTPIDLDFILLKDTINFTYQKQTGCTQVPAAPVNSDTAHSILSFAQDSWQLISFDINNLSTSYKELWFRAKFSSGASPITTNFLFDSVCIKQKVNPNAILENDLKNKLTLYPNPVQNFMEVELSQPNTKYQITDVMGATVMSGHNSSSKFTIDVSSLRSGVYLFSFLDNGNTHTRKFIKQ